MLNGGDIEWIRQGLKQVDPRIAKFAEINEILAFVPWKLSNKNIEYLMKSDTVKGWNFQQVLTACCVLVHYHALSSFVLGQGLTEEPDLITDQMLHASSD